VFLAIAAALMQRVEDASTLAVTFPVVGKAGIVTQSGAE
jgi:hypothetical protein